jgi:hypothetical protein
MNTSRENFVYIDYKNNFDTLLNMKPINNPHHARNRFNCNVFQWVNNRSLFTPTKDNGYFGFFSKHKLQMIREHYLIPQRVELFEVSVGYSEQSEREYFAVWVSNPHHESIQFTIGWIPSQFVSVCNNCTLIPKQLTKHIYRGKNAKRLRINTYHVRS